MEQYYGTGRRKRSVARVFLRPGSGKIVINNRDFAEFFKRDIYNWKILMYTQRSKVAAPQVRLELFDMDWQERWSISMKRTVPH